jgi:hypothetical protein
MYWLSSCRASGGEVLWRGRILEGLDIINIQMYSMDVGRKGKWMHFRRHKVKRFYVFRSSPPPPTGECFTQEHTSAINHKSFYSSLCINIVTFMARLQKGRGLVIGFVGFLHLVTSSNNNSCQIYTDYNFSWHPLGRLNRLNLHQSFGNDFQ